MTSLKDMTKPSSNSQNPLPSGNGINTQIRTSRLHHLLLTTSKADPRCLQTNKSHAAANHSPDTSYLPSYHHLSNDNMGLRNLLRIPVKNRRARSEVRSEANPVEATQVDLALPHSRLNLGIQSLISPTPVPSTSKNQEPSGMHTSLFKRAHLTTFPHNPDNVAHDPTRSDIGVGRDEKSGSSKHIAELSVMDENGSNQESTTYPTTKLAINLVEELSDIVPLLESVAGSLSAILDHCDV